MLYLKKIEREVDMSKAPTFHRERKKISLDETKNPEVINFLKLLNQLSADRPDLKMKIDETLLAFSLSHMPKTQDVLMFITLMTDYHKELSDLDITQSLIDSLNTIYGESNMETYKENLLADIQKLHHGKQARI
jgi:hypothetical protein